MKRIAMLMALSLGLAILGRFSPTAAHLGQAIAADDDGGDDGDGDDDDSGA